MLHDPAWLLLQRHYWGRSSEYWQRQFRPPLNFRLEPFKANSAIVARWTRRNYTWLRLQNLHKETNRNIKEVGATNHLRGDFCAAWPRNKHATPWFQNFCSYWWWCETCTQNQTRHCRAWSYNRRCAKIIPQVCETSSFWIRKAHDEIRRHYRPSRQSYWIRAKQDSHRFYCAKFRAQIGREGILNWKYSSDSTNSSSLWLQLNS